MHVFVILRHGRLETYHDYDSIPRDFDNIIRFEPEIPPGPHTDAQHEEIEQWNEKFLQLVRIENARSN
jgi:hypothetical protein